MLDDVMDDPVPGPSPEERHRWWFRRHPWWSVVLVLFFLFALDIALLPFGTLLSFRTEHPDRTAFQRGDLERQEEAGIKRPRIRKTWTPYSRIPKVLVRAVLVSEDAMFWQHSGFDTFEIKQSITEAMTEGRDLRGASTITQQLVKNLFLSSSRDPFRKLHESILTIVAEQALGKRRILELYLNEIEWGPGVYGAAAAARYHFDVPLDSLTPWQAAFLASIIPSPTRYSPDGITPYLGQRIARTIRRIGIEEVQEDSLTAAMSAVPPDSMSVPIPDSTDRPLPDSTKMAGP